MGRTSTPVFGIALCVLALCSTAWCDGGRVVVIAGNHSAGRAIGCVFVGRTDVASNAYYPLIGAMQSAFANTSSSRSSSLWVAISPSVDLMGEAVDALAKQGNISSSNIFFMGHSMSDGGAVVQSYARAQPNSTRAVVLLSSFLQRVQRPDVRQCLTEVKYQPKPSIKYPLGYLKSGLHNCFGPNIIDFPTPTLTIGGDLDGIVRITRIAEAYYTQQVLQTDPVERAKFPISVVNGMNHGAVLGAGDEDLKPDVRAKDLMAEISPSYARQQVASLIVPFIHGIMEMDDGVQVEKALSWMTPTTTTAGSSSSFASSLISSSAFFEPIVTAFVDMEGNWFFKGDDDEHGSSRWSAMAQEWMALPMPRNFTFTTTNANHLLSDEEWIPPYYRHKHRPQINVTGYSSLSTATVLQQRFIEISPFHAGYGLDGYEIIKEEKLNILTAIPDDGSAYSSTIELATKLASRQKIYNVTGFPSPPTLDDGNRCASINQRAYQWALQSASAVALNRFDKYGVPMKMMPDRTTTIPAGPWWIWTYMNYSMKDSAMEVSSYKAFFSLSANKYGAGNHYCKLLSPARALEWVYIDSLRKNRNAATV